MENKKDDCTEEEVKRSRHVRKKVRTGRVDWGKKRKFLSEVLKGMPKMSPLGIGGMGGGFGIGGGRSSGGGFSI